MSAIPHKEFKKVKLSNSEHKSLTAVSQSAEPRKISLIVTAITAAFLGLGRSTRSEKSSSCLLHRPKKHFIVTAITAAFLGFAGQLYIDWHLLHYAPVDDSPYGIVVQRSQVVALYKHPIQQVERYLTKHPKWEALNHQATFLAMLLQKGDATIRSALILSFLATSAVMLAHRLQLKNSV